MVVDTSPLYKKKGIRSISSLTALILLAGVMTLFSDNNSLMSFLLLFLLVCESLMVYNYSNKEQRMYLFGILLFSLIIWLVTSYFSIVHKDIFNTPFAPSRFIAIYCGILIGYVLVFIPLNIRKIKLYAYFVVAFFFVNIVILRIPYTDLTGGEFKGVAMAICMMTLVIPVLYLEYRYRKRIGIMLPLMQFMVSLFTMSRIALGASALVLIFTLFVSANSMKKVFVRYFYIIILSALSAAVIAYFVAYAADFDTLAKFTDLGDDTHGREDIWMLYFFNFNLHDFLWGRPVEGLFSNAGDLQNAHNTWIQLHSAIGVLSIIFMYLYLYIMLWNVKRNLFFCLLLGSLLFFSFYNYVFFFRPMDWTLYLFFFEFLKNRKEKAIKGQPIKLAIF